MSLSGHILPHCPDVGTRWPCRQFSHLRNLQVRSLRAWLSTLDRKTLVSFIDRHFFVYLINSWPHVVRQVGHVKPEWHALDPLSVVCTGMITPRFYMVANAE